MFLSVAMKGILWPKQRARCIAADPDLSFTYRLSARSVPYPGAS
jgi:hypothetical protein